MIDFETEKHIFNQGVTALGAIDEAGRGPLAGPVVAVCVICGPDFVQNKDHELIKDSKKISPKKREMLYQLITESFSEIGIGICDHDTVDRINILQASFLAMKKAIGCLRVKPEYVILDGKFPIPNFTTKQQPIIQGDSQVFSIAAASIVAKVVRDRIMCEQHEKYPAYNFDKHKGYGTKLHMEKLEQFGPCPIHRKSFNPVKSLLKR